MIHGNCGDCKYYVAWGGCIKGVPLNDRWFNNDGYWTCEQFKERNDNDK